MKMNEIRKALAGISLCSLVLTAGPLAAQAATKTDDKPAGAPMAVTNPNAPKLFIAEEKKDVGTVPKGEPIKHTFILQNRGKSDLHITDVKPSCGCTVPEFDKVIKPGAEGKILLTVDTKNFSQGPISKTAVILTDDPSMPQQTVYVTAIIKPYVETIPYGFFRIQGLTGDTLSSDLILVSDEEDFKPTKAETTQSFLKTSIAPVSEKERVPNKGKHQYKVTLTCDPTAPEGLVGGSVKVITGVKKQPELELQISGVIKSTVSVTPVSVNFGNFDPKETKGAENKRKVMVVNNNLKNDKFTVVKVESSVPGVVAQVEPIENDKARFNVVLSVDSKIKKGVFEGEVKIKTTDGARGEIKVPIKGVVL